MGSDEMRERLETMASEMRRSAQTIRDSVEFAGTEYGLSIANGNDAIAQVADDALAAISRLTAERRDEGSPTPERQPMIPTAPVRQLPEGFRLEHGAHKSFDEGACVMEAVAWLAGHDHTDSPPCACRVISSFLIRTNDAMDDETRQILLPLAPKIVGTATTDLPTMLKRGRIAADWACRTVAPAILRARGFGELADKCESLAEIVDRDTAIAARDLLRQAQSAAAAAYAAYAAAADAAAYGAYAADAAAADAAADAADGAYAAAAAAAYAAYAAAADADAAAARKALYAAVTKEGITIAESAVRCVERMIACTPPASGETGR